MPDQSFDPERIREMRGDLSREAFAKLVGVTPLSIYRWELPPDAAESRRPRRASRKKLLDAAEKLVERQEPANSPDDPSGDEKLRSEAASLASADEAMPAARTTDATQTVPDDEKRVEASVQAMLDLETALETPLTPSSSERLVPNGERRTEEVKAVSSVTPHSAQWWQAQSIAHAELFPVLEDLLDARWQDAEETLFQLLSETLADHREGRAQAQVFMCLIQLFGRGEIRGAFGALLPVLAEVEERKLPDSVAAWAFTAAALVFSVPYGQLFDVGKTANYGSRARRLLRGHDSHPLQFLLSYAQTQAVYHWGDTSLFFQICAKNQTKLEIAEESGHLCRILGIELRAQRAHLAGQTLLAVRWLERLQKEAEAHHFATVHCRALAFSSWIALNAAEPADSILALVQQARELAEQARLETGFQDTLLLAAEAEALMRLGRFVEAEAAMQRGQQVAARLHWPAVDLIFCQIHLQQLCGRPIPSEPQPYVKPIKGPRRHSLKSCEQYLQALNLLEEGRVAEASSLLESLHSRLLGSRFLTWLLHSARLLALASQILEGQFRAAKRTIRAMQKNLDQFPSIWFTAQLRLYEAILRAVLGQGSEARHNVEAALLTFTRADDAINITLARQVDVLIRSLALEERASEQRDSIAAEFEQLGIRIPPLMRWESLQKIEIQRPVKFQSLQPVKLVSSLRRAVDRLATRNIAPARIYRDFVELLSKLCSAEGVWLDEISSTGTDIRIAELGETEESEPDREIEFHDHCGHSFRLALLGEVSEEQVALAQILATVVGLSLEIVSLRGWDEPLVEAGPERTEHQVAIPGMVGVSAPMRSLRSDIARLSGSDATVLITGESGTGKEVVAHAIHKLSKRKNRPYITFNCSAVPRELFEGQLFGYRKGAFTGATANHKGVIRAADTGTLFLDEIGDLPLDLQPKLLRFLENSEICPLGEQKNVQVDVRVVAATHRDLEKMVQKKTFREDLFYRLQVVPIQLLPLRERREDILALTRHFVAELTPEDEVQPTLAPDAIGALLDHDWPGNAREIRNVIARALAFSPLPKSLGAKELRIESLTS